MSRRMLVALLLLLPAAMPASPAAADTRYLLLSGRDTVAIERCRESATQLSGAVLIGPAGLRMDYVLGIGSGGTPRREWPTHLELSLHRLADPDSAPPVQHLTATFSGDTVRAITGSGPEQVSTGASGAWPFANPSMALLVRAIRGRRPAAGDSAFVPLLMPSGGRVLTAVLHPLGPDSVRVSLGGIDMCFAVDARGGVTGGAIPSQGVRIEVGTVAADEAFGSMAGPDYSAPAGATYTAESVRVPVAGGYELAGTLTTPKGAKRALPCVVTITGSGQEDRDEAVPGVKGYRPFRQVAEALAGRGIATLRLDDRGFGESGGDPTRATTADFADDVRAALAWLRARPGIDGRRLALLGHSEGGLIAPMVAADDPAVRALVLLAAPSRTGRSVIEYQHRQLLAGVHDLADSAREARVRAAMAQVDSSAATVPWLAYFLAYDPLPAARRVRVPVLVLQGATDRQVEAVQAGELGAALRAGGNRDVTVKVLPATNHLFLADANGDPAGYAGLEEHAIRPAVLATIADWLAARLR